MSTVNFPVATLLKKITLPHPTAINCQQSHREDWGLMDPSLICENMLTGLVVYRSCANNYSYSVFMSTVAMTCSKDVIPTYIFHSLSFSHFPNLFSTFFHEPKAMILFKAENSMIIYSRPNLQPVICINHHLL